jgi:HSP20 family molecular chaperone IbpA
VAGVPQDRVEVTFEGGLLTIAVKAVPIDLRASCFARSDRGVTGSARWSCPRRSTQGASPLISNGVLTVRVPKAAKAKPVRIPIGAADKLIEA